MKKDLKTPALENELDRSAFFEQSSEQKEDPKPEPTPTPMLTQTRDNPRKVSRELPREQAHTYPTREDIQLFSFHLRDALKVKVQAEVPHQWQEELDDLARDLKVGKLELYRYIIGQFLGKTEQGRGEDQ